jgi:hypothetical protein
MQDRERSLWTWRNLRDGGLSFLISISVFGATAAIASALLKRPFFAGFLDRDGYWTADGLAGLIAAIAWLCTIFFLARLLEKHQIMSLEAKRPDPPNGTQQAGAATVTARRDGADDSAT